MEQALPLAFIKRQFRFFFCLLNKKLRNKRKQQVVWQRPLRKIGFP